MRVFGFGEEEKVPAGPAALTSLNDVITRIDLLEQRYIELEDCLADLCYAVKEQIDRIDVNTQTLNKNMRRLAEMTIVPPKNMLDGGKSDPN